MENTSVTSMECFKEGEWVVLHQLNNKRLARVGRKGVVLVGKDCVSLEGVIGCLPWTNFKMTPQGGSKTGRPIFNLVPIREDDEVEFDGEEMSGMVAEDKDNRTINDDGQSQSLSSIEIEALREGGLTGKEIVHQLVAGSATYDKKTRFAQSKYLRKKESKHCLRERVSIRKTSLSSVAEVLCSGGGGEGSRGSITGMRPDTLSQMLTALNIQWKKSHSVSSVPEVTSPSRSNHADCSQGTTYVIYESGNWGLLVASLLTYLPSFGCRLLHLYPGHGVPCLIAPRALNLPHEKLSILSSVNLKALIQKLRNLGNMNTFSKNQVKDQNVENTGEVENSFPDKEEKSVKTSLSQDCNEQDRSDEAMEGSQCSEDQKVTCADSIQSEMDNHDAVGKSNKRKLENTEECTDGETVGKKPRWEQEAELAAASLTSCKADGLVVVACREHPVSIVLSLLPYLAPSRPLVVYCPYREPLLELYAVLKGWDPWVGRYGEFGSKDTLPRVANLRVMENWLRNYQVLPDRTHPEVNMSPGGGFILTGVLIDLSDE